MGLEGYIYGDYLPEDMEDFGDLLPTLASEYNPINEIEKSEKIREINAIEQRGIEEAEMNRMRKLDKARSLPNPKFKPVKNVSSNKQAQIEKVKVNEFFDKRLTSIHNNQQLVEDYIYFKKHAASYLNTHVPGFKDVGGIQQMESRFIDELGRRKLNNAKIKEFKKKIEAKRVSDRQEKRAEYTRTHTFQEELDDLLGKKKKGAKRGKNKPKSYEEKERVKQQRIAKNIAKKLTREPLKDTEFVVKVNKQFSREEIENLYRTNFNDTAEMVERLQNLFFIATIENASTEDEGEVDELRFGHYEESAIVNGLYNKVDYTRVSFINRGRYYFISPYTVKLVSDKKSTIDQVKQLTFTQIKRKEERQVFSKEVKRILTGLANVTTTGKQGPSSYYFVMMQSQVQFQITSFFSHPSAMEMTGEYEDAGQSKWRFAMFGQLDIQMSDEKHLNYLFNAVPTTHAEQHKSFINYKNSFTFIALLISRAITRGCLGGMSMDVIKNYFSYARVNLVFGYGKTFLKSRRKTDKKFEIPLFSSLYYEDDAFKDNFKSCYDFSWAHNNDTDEEVKNPFFTFEDLNGRTSRLVYVLIASVFYWLTLYDPDDQSKNSFNDLAEMDDHLQDLYRSLNARDKNSTEINILRGHILMRRLEEIQIKFFPKGEIRTAPSSSLAQIPLRDKKVNNSTQVVRSRVSDASNMRYYNKTRRFEDEPLFDFEHREWNLEMGHYQDMMAGALYDGEEPITQEESPPRYQPSPNLLDLDISDEEREPITQEDDDSSFSGCQINRNKKLPATFIRLDCIYEPPSNTEQNCLFECLLMAVKSKEINNTDYYKILRQRGFLRQQTHLEPSDVQFFADDYGVRIHFYKVCDIKDKKMNDEDVNDNDYDEYHERVFDPHGNGILTNLIAQNDNAHYYIRKFHTLMPSFTNSDNEDVEGSSSSSSGTTTPDQTQQQKTNFLRNQNTQNIHIIIHENHAYLCTNIDIILKKVKCKNCHNWLAMNNFIVHSYTCKFCHICHHAFQKSGTAAQPNEPFHPDCRGPRPNIHKREMELKRRRGEAIVEDVTAMDIIPLAIAAAAPALNTTKTRKLLKRKEKQVDADVLEMLGDMTMTPTTTAVSNGAREWVSLNPVKKSKNKKSNKQIFIADIEAFTCAKNGHFIPCMIAVTTVAQLEIKNIQFFSGPTCMKNYLTYLTETATQGSNLYYFNGAKFDNFIHLQGLLDNDFPIVEGGFIRHAGRIIQMYHNKNLKIRDLCPWFKSSLAQACKDWGVPDELSKKDFNHESVYDWPSFYKEEKVMREYLAYDIISLGTLYKIYSKIQFDNFNIDINTSMTPSLYSLNCWLSTMPDETVSQFYIPTAGKEEDDIRKSYTGGRVGPQIISYESADYKKCFNKTITSYDDIHDYLVFFDVKSLYPAAQFHYPIAYGKHEYITCYCAPTLIRTEEQQTIDRRGAYYVHLLNSLVDEREIMRCLFCVDVTCPRDLQTAFLFEKNYDTGIYLSLPTLNSTLIGRGVAYSNWPHESNFNRSSYQLKATLCIKRPFPPIFFFSSANARMT